jgi:hypothetical protein
MGASIRDVEVDPSVPEDVRRAVARVMELLRRVGLPSRGSDGAHQVLVATAGPRAVTVECMTYARALRVLDDPDDPEVQGHLRRVAAQTETAARAVVLFAIGEDGDWWCGAVGPATETAERAEARR